MPPKKTHKLYTHDQWIKYAWESINDSKYIEWDIYRCAWGDPHPPPDKSDKVFYTDSELAHALAHDCKTKIAFMLEARTITPGYYNFLEDHIDAFDKVLTHCDDLVASYPDKCIFYPHGNCVIRREDFEIYEKSKLISFISSYKKMNVSGHALRHAFYDLYVRRKTKWTSSPLNNVDVDFYGSLVGNHIKYKLDALKDYMFQIVIENSILNTYFTEKIIDCFVTGTVPIYYGTKNIGRFFDANGIIQIATVEDIFAILRGLKASDYAARSQAIAKNFQLARQYVVAEDWIYENTDVFN